MPTSTKVAGRSTAIPQRGRLTVYRRALVSLDKIQFPSPQLQNIKQTLAVEIHRLTLGRRLD